MKKWVVFCLPTVVFSFGKLPEIVFFKPKSVQRNWPYMEYLHNSQAKCHDFFCGWKMALYLRFYVVFITIKMVFSEKFPKNCVFEVFYSLNLVKNG